MRATMSETRVPERNLREVRSNFKNGDRDRRYAQDARSGGCFDQFPANADGKVW